MHGFATEYHEADLSREEKCDSASELYVDGLVTRNSSIHSPAQRAQRMS
jgi:hypothetical protein